MINRFKSALINAVSNTGLDASVVGLSGGNSGNSSSSRNSNNEEGGGHHSRKGSRRGEGGHNNSENGERIKRHEYSRPHFLQLNTSDEITVTADHGVRPIIVPRDLTCIPWESGYAETINSGKSKLNEDQARVHFAHIRVEIPIENGNNASEMNGHHVVEENGPSGSGGGGGLPRKEILIPYYFFALFDGHAGAGAAVAAAAQLHDILNTKLHEVGVHLVQDGPFCESVGGKAKKGVYWYPQISVTKDSLIVGALEAAFNEMDETIRDDNLKYDGVNGGCTAVICLFILGKVYTANAGDSRAIYCMKNSEPVPLSQDFTPETERSRVRLLAAQRPELLGNDFTSNEYLRRPVKKDIGTQIMYRAAHMTGWAYKTASLDDMKFPVVFGHGKRSRVLATIGVTRGFGDHELYAHSSNIRIKPFLSSQPEVKILDLTDNLDEDSVIVMGTDGLWDVTANATASRIVFSTLDQFPVSDKNRYKYRFVSAAQDLVMHARGKFNDKNWKMSDGSGKAATIDDISVFVIPIAPYRKEWVTQHNYSDDIENSISFDNSNANGISQSHEVAKDVLDTVLDAVKNLTTKDMDPNVPRNAIDHVLSPPLDVNAVDVQLEVEEPNH